MRIKALMAVLISAFVVRCSAQQQESLFLDAVAYDPLPSPDGKLVAYLLTGRNLSGGSGGFGRSNLRSAIAFANADGTNNKDSGSTGFLGQWLTDGSALVSFRDWRFALVGPDGGGQSGSMPSASLIPGALAAERVAYVATTKAFVWLEHRGRDTLLQTSAGPIGTFKGLLALSAVIIPSPDGRYIAIGGQGPFLYEDHNLQIFDLKRGTWTNLGPLTIHPDPQWDYTKPNWSPWFPDSKRLAFFSSDSLCITRPDGTERHDLLRVRNGGLATVSPRGSSIAYVTFAPFVSRRSSGQLFWGGSTLWSVSTSGGIPSQITKASGNETLVLRWLTEKTLIFDRVDEALMNADAHIWKVSALKE